MRELVGRLTALDPDAGAALLVIEYFDKLAEGHVGLEVLVRSAAVLAGCPAGLNDPQRRVLLRVLPDGRREDGQPAGITLSLGRGSDACVWLERVGERHANDEIVLERLAFVARAVVDRTNVPLRGVDPASVELLVDGGTDHAAEARQAAADRLGLPRSSSLCVVVSLAGARWRRARTARISLLDVTVEPASTPAAQLPDRAGIGPSGSLDQLPRSYQQARIALRLSASGTPDDPGPMQVSATELGGLLALGDGCDGPAAIAETDILRTVLNSPVGVEHHAKPHQQREPARCRECAEGAPLDPSGPGGAAEPNPRIHPAQPGRAYPRLRGGVTPPSAAEQVLRQAERHRPGHSRSSVVTVAVPAAAARVLRSRAWSHRSRCG